MLDFNLPEMAVVAIIALVVIGPKDLPKAMRVVGYWLGRARGVARQFRAGFDDMVREAELAEMEKKWRAENERIMRLHAPDAAPAEPALPAPDPVPADYARHDGDTAPAGHDDTGANARDDDMPVMTERPAIEPPTPVAADKHGS